MRRLFTDAIFHCIVAVVAADVYFHNPRGSNNRLDEASRNRANANRLYDSQNNDRGGYNVGSVYYYAGSKLHLEWTNQHSCSDPHNNCELVIQYMCHDFLRDGTTTNTIPENPTQCSDYDCNRDFRYGMHESYDQFLTCKMRKRNRRLYTADQKLKKNSAQATRQNPGGTRRGYECAEERDYYPYWHPTWWRDIVVMTNNASRCPYYQAESENVKPRWACAIPLDVLQIEMHGKHGIIPNNQEGCENFRWPANDPNGTVGVWTEFASHGLPPPDCRETEHTRDNHLGNGATGYPNSYEWTVPEMLHEHCSFRIRYNISTGDYDSWNTNASMNTLTKKARVNGNQFRTTTCQSVDVHSRFGFENCSEAADRGYLMKNNPVVEIFPGYNLDLRLAINTAQFGRTFQDRWTGSNTNPDNNDGQGRAGSDRSNVVLQETRAYVEGSGAPYKGFPEYGHWGRSYPRRLGNVTLLGLTREDLTTLAILDTHQYGGEMSELDDAGTYFDLGPRKVTETGVFHYMSTRNNNFSNRSQKGKLVVRDQQMSSNKIGWNGGNFTIPGSGTGVYIDRGTLDTLQEFSLEQWSIAAAEARLAALDAGFPEGDGFGSDVMLLLPQNKVTPGENRFTMKIDLDSHKDVEVYHANTQNFVSWQRLEGTVENGAVEFSTDRGGIYVVRTNTNIGMIVGITVACAAIALIIVGSVIYFKKHPSKWETIASSATRTKRSLQGRV
ncbi:PREDICTED: protein DD3-3-like [Priapulus caudatus]|uniref:Protein DD3-3-like n=1 Tax=Priapulus caudatus TaxID=37621 RepID=A0ABM1DWP3_PRICU|nr:PREDICTED: protein DD3-3-like [Priapulus caudatus]